MKLSRLLFREKTQAVVKQTVTFNAPGTYYPPYGKTAFLLQGQGQPGNASSGGNIAGYNASGGNIAGYNASGGNYAGERVYQTAYYYDSGNGANQGGGIIFNSPSCPSGYSTNSNLPSGNFATYAVVYSCTPYYNPYNPGNPNYNAYNPGNPNYNTYYPGNTGPSYNVLGVNLPGGAADSAAQVVGYVPVTIDYTTSGISISCPPGGYVKIQNL